MSRARARLFELAELVRRSGDDTAVVLEQRGGGEAVALVREARLVYLESRVKQMDEKPHKRFSVAGSLASDLDDRSLDEVLRDLRKAWASPRSDRSR